MNINESVYYIENNASLKLDEQPCTNDTKSSLGCWVFDKRTRKRKYVALTGKIYTGPEGIRKAKIDQQSESRTTRSELKYLMSVATAQSILLKEKSIGDFSLWTLPHWGFPDAVVDRYKRIRVNTLFPWQVECLTVDDGAVLRSNRNLIYSAPTSGGKTLVSEILMLRNLAKFTQLEDNIPSSEDKSKRNSQRHTVFFVVPFIALAEEKCNYFQDIWQDMNIGIKAFHGDGGELTGNTLTEDVEVAVCTIERANILLTQLLDEGREDQLKMIVIDEIHMLSDNQRGFLLEVMLSKVKYLLLDKVQIVGMSATLPNIEDLAKWLDASLYTTTYRPVDLDVRVCLNRNIYSVTKLSQSTSKNSNGQNDSTVDYVNFNSNQLSKANMAAIGSINSIDESNISDKNNINITSNATLFASVSHAPSSLDNNNNIEEVLPPSSSSAAATTVATSDEVIVNYAFEREVLHLADDPAGLKRLCLETMMINKSVMLFCNSKRRCEVCATAVADAVRKHLHSITVLPINETKNGSSNGNNNPSNLSYNNSSYLLSHYAAPVGQTMSSSSSSMNASFAAHSFGCNNNIAVKAAMQNHQLASNHHHANVTDNVATLHHCLPQPPSNQQQQQHSITSVATAMRTARISLIESLGMTQVGLCPVLRATIPYGVAYHHAGLTLDERKIIEDGFREGVLQVLCTTSTLSAGVNLPAHRVIIRSPRMGDRFLTVSSFRQMCGRAGRMGLDQKGEAILMIAAATAATTTTANGAASGSNNNSYNNSMRNNNNTPATTIISCNSSNSTTTIPRNEKEVATMLLTADLDPLCSNLHLAQGGGLEKLLLEMISCGRLHRESDVMKFVDCTLMKVQQRDYQKVISLARSALIFLKKEQFVQSLSDGQLSASPLGAATTISGIAPKDAVLIIKPLLDARRKLILKGGLHPVYLVTPPSTTIEPDWNNYEKMLHFLYQEHPDAELVATHLGINQAQLCKYAFKHPPTAASAALNNNNSNNNSSCDSYQQVQLYRRFFSSILLFTLIQEWPITSVTRLLSSVTRGQLQQLQKDAAVFCGMTVVFCRKLNWSVLASCLEDFSSRLNFGVHKDILPLVRLGQEITAPRARIFYKNGIETAQDIIYSGVTRLTELLLDSLPYDGRDPLEVSCGSIDTNDNNRTSVGNDIIHNFNNKSREHARLTCERLARKILHRAKENVKEEAKKIAVNIKY